MSKKRGRITNPEPFMPVGADAFSSKKRHKPPKKHQLQEKLVPSAFSSKILKEAVDQQREIEREENNQNGVPEPNPQSTLLFQIQNLRENDDDEDDLDGFDCFSETQSQFGELNFEDELDEREQKLLNFFLSKDDRPQQTLADIIVKRIKEKDAQVSSGGKQTPQLDDAIIKIFKDVGLRLCGYTAGKLPLAFKRLPSLPRWEELLHLTEPEKWSPNAVYQATRIFSSNMGSKKVERFYKYVLLPRVREDIRKNKRLHFALYQSLKKALYKPAAFNMGILIPLCKSRTCTLREAVIVGSIIEKVSIPHLHSSVALMKLADMEYCGTTSYFIKLLIEKKYALPYRVVDALVAHFMRFLDSQLMPVIWHQSLLAFVQRYKNDITGEDRANLGSLVEIQHHKLVTPEILRELNHGRNRGEVDDPMKTSTPISVVNMPIQEDRFDVPDVPMED